MMNTLPVNKWAKEDQPREKMTSLGVDCLTNAELLAILIGSGSAKESAVDLMKRILNDCNNNLRTLGKMSVKNLCCYNGIGEAKAISILAACELCRRRQAESEILRNDLSTAVRICNYMIPKIGDLDVEEFWIMMMNQDYKLIKAQRISRGGISETSVDIRIIMKECVMNNATILAVCHNHPSGSLKPSRADEDLTQSIKRACQTMRIHFQDHVIVTDSHYYSFHESGKI